VFLFGPQDAHAPPATDAIGAWVPGNFFGVLAAGQPLGILMCAIVFGLALATVTNGRSDALATTLEASYRAFEFIISNVNLLIPPFAFAMAAFFVAETDVRTLQAMGTFLATFFGIALLLATAAFTLICQRAHLPPSSVLSALKTPALISLASGRPTATIPDTIHAMSTQLGFSRGIVELIVPTASVFLRTGTALYYAVLAVFVSHIYAQPIGLPEFGVICLGATLASFASAGSSGAALVAGSAAVLAALKLPVEAALTLFVALDVLCEPIRSLLTLLLSCVLIVLVSAGLPSERTEPTGARRGAAGEPLRLVFTGTTAAIALACGVVAGLLITLMGIGIGLR
jgi:Na+/H+-dicarboxylate symporter